MGQNVPKVVSTGTDRLIWTREHHELIAGAWIDETTPCTHWLPRSCPEPAGTFEMPTGRERTTRKAWDYEYSHSSDRGGAFFLTSLFIELIDQVACDLALRTGSTMSVMLPVELYKLGGVSFGQASDCSLCRPFPNSHFCNDFRPGASPSAKRGNPGGVHDHSRSPKSSALRASVPQVRLEPVS